MNIIFVKWGTKYSSEDVNILFESIFEYDNGDNEYFCYTENPVGLHPTIKIIPIPTKPALKVWWNKLKMFDKDFPLSGPTLYFDIDTKVVNDPFKMEIDFGVLTIINCHWKNSKIYDRPTNYDVRVNSSLIAWNADNSRLKEIWEWFNNSGQRDYFLRKYVGIDRYLVHEEFEHQTFPTEYICSWKYEDPNEKTIVITYEELDYGSGSVIQKP